MLITFKSPRSIPPYRIENNCDDVIVWFAQTAVAWDRNKWNWLRPRAAGACMAYAWDEPILQHKLTIQVCLHTAAAHALYPSALPLHCSFKYQDAVAQPCLEAE